MYKTTAKNSLLDATMFLSVILINCNIKIFQEKTSSLSFTDNDRTINRHWWVGRFSTKALEITTQKELGKIIS